MKRCSYCGRETVDEARRCWECGSEFNGAERWRFDIRLMDRGARWLAVGMTFLAALLLSIVGYSAIRSVARQSGPEVRGKSYRGGMTVLAEKPNPNWQVIYRLNPAASNASGQRAPVSKH